MMMYSYFVYIDGKETHLTIMNYFQVQRSNLGALPQILLLVRELVSIMHCPINREQLIVNPKQFRCDTTESAYVFRNVSIR